MNIQRQPCIRRLHNSRRGCTRGTISVPGEVNLSEAGLAAAPFSRGAADVVEEFGADAHPIGGGQQGEDALLGAVDRELRQAASVAAHLSQHGCAEDQSIPGHRHRRFDRPAPGKVAPVGAQGVQGRYRQSHDEAITGVYTRKDRRCPEQNSNNAAASSHPPALGSGGASVTRVP